MSPDDPALAALVASRICHDLASPLGAAGNGLELLSMTTPEQSVELSLVQDSLRAARATLDLVRLAFGRTGAAEDIATDALRDVLAAYYADKPRLSLCWRMVGTLPGGWAQIIALASMAMETSLPRGGTLEVSGSVGKTSIIARGAGLIVDAALWKGLNPDTNAPTAQPRLVEFSILRERLKAEGLMAEHETGADHLILTLRVAGPGTACAG